MVSRTLVVVVDDDESVRESLPDLLGELGFAARAFASAEEFLSSDSILTARCLLLDIGLPGMSGPELRRELVRQGRVIPTVFITAKAKQSVPPALLNEEHGAVACLFKPFGEEELRAALDAALGRT
jgi:FixJ family two-component response regulator